MGYGFEGIEISAWRQTDVENDIIFGLQAIFGKEELWDNLSDMSVTDSDRLGVTVKHDRREA